MKKLVALAVLTAFTAGGFAIGSWITWRASTRPPSADQRKVMYYTCPMHPQYRSDREGDCPSCGMHLVPVAARDVQASPVPALVPGTLRVSEDRQQIIGVRFAVVERVSISRTIRTVGRVTVDENRVYRVVASTEGIVRSLSPVVTGGFVRREQPLLTLYSSDFLQAQQAYFYALDTLDRITRGKTEPTEQYVLTNAQLRSAVDNLRTLGMSQGQIVALGKSRKLTRDVDLVAPVTGYVLSRAVFPEQRLERNTELYRIADLSRVWVLADLFESDAPYVRSGTPVRLSLPYGQVASIQARVSDVLPQFDTSTRTLKVRLEIDNPDMALRPDMFVDVQVAVNEPSVLSVPAEAIVDSGASQTVFVDRGNGYFEPRRVRVGLRSPDRVEIVKGLMAGERVVVSGNFLLGSESRMHLAGMGISSPETDPVCGMDVDQTAAKDRGRIASHDGSTFYFCSEQCKRTFEANPDQYLEPGPLSVPATKSHPEPRATASSGSHASDPELDRVAERVAEADRSLNVTAAAAGGRTIFATDPVCGAEVETTAPDVVKSVFQGTTYYFFSGECKAEFERDPAKYVDLVVVAPPASKSMTRSPATFLLSERAARQAASASAPQPTAAAETAGQATDPVCGMTVDVKDTAVAGRTGTFKGRTYYFCSDECKGKFEKDPAKYVKAP